MTASVARQRQRLLVFGLHLVAVGILALQTFVRRFPPTATAIPEAGSPEALWWGLWPITYLPDSLFLAGATAILLLIGFLWWREFAAKPAPSNATHLLAKSGAWYALVIISSLLILAFYAFPIVHTRWGDAYILSRAIAWPDPALRLTRSWQAPLDVFLHSSLWLALQPRMDWQDAVPVYRILSPIAGAIYLFVLLMLSRSRVLAPSWLTFGLLSTLGLIQLFFGYVENYSFAAAAVLAYLWLGIQLTQGKGSLWIAATVFTLANALHPSTLILAPSLLHLAWLAICDRRNQGNNHLPRVVLQVGAQIVVPMAIIYGLTGIMMESGGHGLTALFTDDRPGGGDARWFVPLREATTEWERYTMFSWPHLRDFMNEQLLIAPVALPSIVWIAVARLTRVVRNEDLWKASSGEVEPFPYAKPEPRLAYFLVVAFLFYLAFTWIWNPDYGGQRDWDLFSLVAIPETLVLVYALTRTLFPWRHLAMGAAPLIAVQALHTASWVYQNTLPWSWP